MEQRIKSGNILDATNYNRDKNKASGCVLFELSFPTENLRSISLVLLHRFFANNVTFVTAFSSIEHRIYVIQVCIFTVTCPYIATDYAHVYGQTCLFILHAFRIFVKFAILDKFAGKIIGYYKNTM